MIKRIKFKGLNNWFDGEYEFHEDLNIFTGSNGSGKTTLLKLIWYLISGNLQFIIFEIPFTTVSVTTDSYSLTLTHDGSNHFEFNYILKEKKKNTENVVVNIDPEDGRLSGYSAHEELERMSKLITDMKKNSLFFPTFRRIEGQFSDWSKLRFSDQDSRSNFTPPSLVPKMLQDSFFELSKVLSNKNHQFISSISTQDIVRLLNKKYSDVSREINEDYRLLTKNIIEIIQTYSCENGSNKQDISDTISVLDNIQESVEQNSLTRADLNKPFTVLADLIEKILKYHSISIVEDFPANEEIEGITFGKGSDGFSFGGTKEVDLFSGKLSSGEKQILSFICYNILSTDSTIFIDEPELSLHIDWQSMLLPILLEQNNNNQFFIATHSPFIYTQYPDKEIQLRSIPR